MKDSTKQRIDEATTQYLEAIQGALDAEITETEAEASKTVEVKTFLQDIERVERIPDFIKAANDAGMEVREWIIDRLTVAVDPNISHLPILRDIYDRFAALAYSRGISLETLGTGQLVSAWLELGFDNGRV